jgi:cytidylate kinase
VTKLVAKQLRLKRVNYTFRNMAREKRIPFKKFYALVGKTFPKMDFLLDRKLSQFVAANKNCVVGTRLAVWLDAPQVKKKTGVGGFKFDLKVWLEAPLAVRAKRIRNREGGSFRKVFEETRERDARDKARYRKAYGIDVSKPKVDLVINVAENNARQVARKITEAAVNRMRKR